ncbi:MAG: hypothetical protein RBU37_11490 [Myxococcota bacterium]|nr:hypothetical protein [Myxococcota bacterium]
MGRQAKRPINKKFGEQDKRPIDKKRDSRAQAFSQGEGQRSTN